MVDTRSPKVLTVNVPEQYLEALRRPELLCLEYLDILLLGFHRESRWHRGREQACWCS